MIEDIRRKLHQQYEEKRLLQMLQARQKQKNLYVEIPELEALDTRYKEMELEILRAAFSAPSHAADAATELRKLFERLQSERTALLARHDIFNDPLVPVHECEQCRDLGILENGEDCHCFQQLLAERIYALSSSSPLSRDLLEYTLDVFSDEKQHENMRSVFMAMREEAQAFTPGSGRNFIFSGPISQGKTYLMESFAGELIKKGVIVYSVTAPSFVDFLRRYRFYGRPEGADQQTYQLIMNCDLLLLDDLGKENATDFVLTELFHLINHRYLNRKSLFISTNLPIHELFVRYDESIWSRVLGNAYAPKFFGPPLKREGQ